MNKSNKKNLQFASVREIAKYWWNGAD